MRKIIYGLLALTSISAFTQVTTYKIPNLKHQGWSESYSYYAKNIEDNGSTTKFSGIFINRVTGVSKREAKKFCKNHGYAGTVKGSETILTKNVFIVRQQKLVRGPNKILDSIECLNP